MSMREPTTARRAVDRVEQHIEESKPENASADWLVMAASDCEAGAARLNTVAQRLRDEARELA